MSQTEIYTFNKKGNAEYFNGINNSHRGAPVIWNYFFMKYFNDDLNEMLQLLDTNEISKEEKIILSSTLDNAIVKKKNFKTLIKIFNEFDLGKKGSLKEQADIFRKIDKDKEYIGIGWNQTSLNANTWEDYYYDEEKDLEFSYNILKNDKHLDIFEKYYK